MSIDAPSTTAAPSPAAAPGGPAAPTTPSPQTVASPAATSTGAGEDDPPATTMANLFRQRASPIRFFIVILVWAVGVLIVGIDTRTRTTAKSAPPSPSASSPEAAATR